MNALAQRLKNGTTIISGPASSYQSYVAIELVAELAREGWHILAIFPTNSDCRNFEDYMADHRRARGYKEIYHVAAIVQPRQNTVEAYADAIADHWPKKASRVLIVRDLSPWPNEKYSTWLDIVSELTTRCGASALTVLAESDAISDLHADTIIRVTSTGFKVTVQPMKPHGEKIMLEVKDACGPNWRTIVLDALPTIQKAPPLAPLVEQYSNENIIE